MGGWFLKEIKSVEDFKGLKMRIPGLAAEVLNRMGGTAVALPGGEIMPSLQSGAIDATEWIGPWNDLAFGFYKITKFYYGPGFHEPSSTLECSVNLESYNSLDLELKSIIKNATHFLNQKNIPYILFVCPSKLLSNSKDYMSLIELKELVKMENVYVGSHSYNHIKLNELEEKKIISELKDSKNFLEQKLSVEVNTISYPFGAIDDRVLKIAKETGYKFGFSTKFDFIKKEYNKLNLPRVDVWDGDNVYNFKNKVIGKWNWMRFFSKY